ncbi:MAG: FHA domain-containing protein [Caldilineaceae bacterium]
MLILQETPSGDASPTLQITRVDSSQFPELKIDVSGANLPAQLQTLPAQIALDGSALPILADELSPQGIQVAIAIDTNDLSVRSQAGQTHYVRLANVLNRLLNADSILVDQDWVAGYWLAGNEPLRQLQTWTQQADLVFDEFVANRPPTLSATPLTTQPLRDLISELAASAADAQMANHVQAIMLFSTGQTAADVQDVIEAAQAQSIRFYVVELRDASPAEAVPNAPINSLEQLAIQTGGHYIALTNPESVAPLSRRLMAAHDSRIFTVRTEATQPQNLDVSLTLPNGAVLVASANVSELEIGDAVAAPPNVLSTPSPPQPTLQPTAAPQEQNLPTAVAGADAATAAGSQTPLNLVAWSVPILLLLGILSLFLWLRKRSARRQQAKRNAATAITPAKGYALADETQQTRFQIELPSSPLSSVARAAGHRSYKSPLIKPRVQHQPAHPDNSPISTEPPSTKRRPEEYYKDFENQLTVLHSVWGENAVTFQEAKTDPPIIGRLVRVVSDPRLPSELPIYGDLSESAPEYWIHIGRHSKQNTIVINDISISRQHAAIIVRNGQLYLSDNDSASGTFLNWKQLTPGDELLLRHKDLVSFGQIAYEYRAQSQEAESGVK